MTRPASSQATRSNQAPNLPPADPYTLPTNTGQSEADRASERVPSEVMRDDANRHLRHRMISEAAYQIYVQRGYADGFELADWLQAEAEVDRLLNTGTTVN